MFKRSFSNALMLFAFVIVQLHACLPHEHVPLTQVDSAIASVEEQDPLWNNLWHIDMGEDHLETFHSDPNPPLVDVFLLYTHPLQLNVALTQRFLFPWTFSLHPPSHGDHYNLRGPPFFA